MQKSPDWLKALEQKKNSVYETTEMQDTLNFIKKFESRSKSNWVILKYVTIWDNLS